MREQNLDDGVAYPVQKQARAELGHGGQTPTERSRSLSDVSR
jgi:hypothetical protein